MEKEEESDGGGGSEGGSEGGEDEPEGKESRDGKAVRRDGQRKGYPGEEGGGREQSTPSLLWLSGVAP